MCDKDREGTYYVVVSCWVDTDARVTVHAV
jgi:hypothetical protein